MSTFSISDACARLPELVERAQSQAVVVHKHGMRAAVLISPQAYDRMIEALEDAEDAAAYDQAMAEEGPSIPWDHVKSDPGIK